MTKRIVSGLAAALVVGTVLMAMPGVAEAGGRGRGRGGVLSAPEFDAGTAGAAAAIVAAGAIVLARRRKRS